MALKVKFRTVFPAVVEAESPILLVKEGVSYTFSLDADALSDTFGALYQPLDDTLTALAALSSTAGLLTQTAADTFVRRTLTGTANEITVTNGAGTAGNPTLSLPTALTFTGKTVTGGSFTGALYEKVTITAPASAATLTLIDGTTLTGPAASGTVMTLGNVETVTGAKTFNDAKLILAGVTSGTTVLKSGAIAASSVLTLPVATDTLMGKATTDTLTNKTFNSAGTGNTLQVSGVTVSSGQYPGETTTGSATAGNVGEYISSTIASGSAVSLTNNTGANITSISLSAGDWDVSGGVIFTGAVSTNATYINGSLSLVTATIDLLADRNSAQVFNAFTVFNTFSVPATPFGPSRISVSGATTVFLVARAGFTVSTCSAYGTIRARRVR